MLAARGVSLGLGKINLSDLNQLPTEKHRASQLRREDKAKRPRIIIKKKADAKTVWAACRAVIFGCIVIAVGLAMTVLGYFDKQFSERIEIIDGAVNVYHDRVVQYQLKSMQYLGPILMGIGSFILIIACVVTLESRDKHAQVITEESMSFKKRRLMSIEERAEMATNEVALTDSDSPAPAWPDNQTKSDLYSISTLAEVHRPRAAASRTAPLADIDSLDLHSCSSQVTTDRDPAETKEV